MNSNNNNNDNLEIRRERFVPTNLAELDKFVDIVAASGMVPVGHCDRDGRPNKASMKLAIIFGDTLGVGPIQSIQNISAVNNMPAVWGDLGLALVKVHPDFVDIIEERQEDGWQCTIKRRGKADVTRKFTIKDAEEAKLWQAIGVSENKRQYSPWVKYPWRMMQWRSRWWAMRDQFPDALKGIQAAEEYIDVQMEPRPSVAIESPADQLRALKKEIEEPKSEELKQTDPELPNDEEKQIDYVVKLETILSDLYELNYELSDKEKKRIPDLVTDAELIKAIEYYEKKKEELINNIKG